MGVVYLAHDPRLDRHVAIKLLPPDLTRDETAKQRFLQEAKAASALDHPNICIIFEINAEGVLKEGDQWKLTSKGETTWGRVESNGQLEVNGTGYGNPMDAYTSELLLRVLRRVVNLV